MAGYRDLDALRSEYASKRGAIEGRLRAFRRTGEAPDARLFEELCFCLLAIQTSARASDAAVRALARGGLLWSGSRREIASFLRHRTRFHNHKAAYIVAARRRFFPDGPPLLKRTLAAFPTPADARAWLVADVDGLGWKEASHFLRNIGEGEDFAILDRHVLRNLARHRVVARAPASLTGRTYLRIESRMRGFAEDVGIPVGALDLLFWSRETGEIFK